jgi:hypothetical protein
MYKFHLLELNALEVNVITDFYDTCRIIHNAVEASRQAFSTSTDEKGRVMQQATGKAIYDLGTTGKPDNATRKEIVKQIGESTEGSYTAEGHRNTMLISYITRFYPITNTPVGERLRKMAA